MVVEPSQSTVNEVSYDPDCLADVDGSNRVRAAKNQLKPKPERIPTLTSKDALLSHPSTT